jgi:hypothetical protein
VDLALLVGALSILLLNVLKAKFAKTLSYDPDPYYVMIRDTSLEETEQSFLFKAS